MMSQTERELAQRWPLIMATCMGIISSSFVLPYYSIGALVAPVTEEFGWSRAQFQAAILSAQAWVHSLHPSLAG